MNIVILMAGSNGDFQEKGHQYPKYLLEIQGKPIIQRIVEPLSSLSDNITCIIRKQDQTNFYLANMLKLLCPSCAVIEVDGETKGAVCTALFAIEKINNDDELLILNGDQLIKADIAKAVNQFRDKKQDAGIITFRAIHPKYSSILLNEQNEIIEVSEKRPISDIASTGCTYYKKGSDFIDACFSLIKKNVTTNGLFYISSTFNEMILEQKHIGMFEIPKDDYVSFSTYQMYENYIAQRNS